MILTECLYDGYMRRTSGGTSTFVVWFCFIEMNYRMSVIQIIGIVNGVLLENLVMGEEVGVVILWGVLKGEEEVIRPLWSSG